MTDALVRRCNVCKKSFLKDDGCNKMRCTCGNTQCFVCSSNISDYSHFGDEDGKCPMYGDMIRMLEDQVSIAQDSTIQRLLSTRTDLTEADIRVRS